MTTCSKFFNNHLDAVCVTEAASRTAGGQRAIERVTSAWRGSVDRIESRSSVPAADRTRRTLVIDDTRGAPLASCPGSKGHLCCNLHTIDLYIGCGIGCSYCIMNGYLNYEPMVVQANVEPIVDAIRLHALSRPERVLRIGSGEVGDSLLLDPVFRLNEEILVAVADLPNVSYEIKTKTEYVDHLLGPVIPRRAVIAFSLNPDHIVCSEEGIAATVDERLHAAKKCVDAGYQVAFHFDPIILTDAFPGDYLSLIDRLASVPPTAVAWISMGTIRFPPSLKEAFLERPFAAAEFVPTRDGKLRYLQPIRIRIYSRLYAALKETIPAPVYMCMESETMWHRVFGSRPENRDELHGIFSRSTIGVRPAQDTRRSS